VRGKAGKLALRPHRQFGSQPDALGLATRLAVARLCDADIVVEPLLRRAGLSVTQISSKDMRIGVASQIMFLELAAQALHDPLFGFRLARDAEVRQLGLLYYVAALSETLGEALLEVGKHVGQDDGAGGVVLRHKIGQGDLAAMAGVARENVSRVMSDWRRNRVVMRSSGLYHLNDIATLKSIMNSQVERQRRPEKAQGVRSTLPSISRARLRASLKVRAMRDGRIRARSSIYAD